MIWAFLMGMVVGCCAGVLLIGLCWMAGEERRWDELD